MAGQHNITLLVSSVEKKVHGVSILTWFTHYLKKKTWFIHVMCMCMDY
jgi:hypothetical protein